MTKIAGVAYRIFLVTDSVLFSKVKLKLREAFVV